MVERPVGEVTQAAKETATAKSPKVFATPILQEGVGTVAMVPHRLGTTL